MGILSKMVKVNGVVIVGGAAFTGYNYPELRKNPGQLVHAMIRGGRCAKVAIMMAKDYLSAEEITSETHETASKRMFDCFCQNGGPYIKLGQMMGQLDQLMPPEYTTTFEPMLMKAPKTAYNDIRDIIKSELGRDIEEMYDDFEEKPIASASLGQVHKAKLKGTDTVVAVKVQHMWIKEQVPGDLRLITFVSDCASYIFPDFKYGWLPDEFQTRLPKELDFQLEAINCKRCDEMFKENPNVVCPKVYDSLTTERVLTMSFESGIPATNVKQMHEQGIDLRRTAKVISETFTYMIFEKGFVHSDPHPGNIFVRPKVFKDGKKDIEIVLLDHGIYTELTEETRLSYTKLWRGILTQNKDKIKKASIELGADFYELFTAMIVNRTYEDVMDESKKSNLKQRLGETKDGEAQEAVKEYAIYYHKDIVDILDQIKRELLLILKTNNYLRAIDKRLGNPTNTYDTINNVTWRVFNREMAKNYNWDYV